MSDVKRSIRVGERVRQELALALRSLRDPRLTGAIISRVEMTDDLQLARVYVRGGAERKELLGGLTAAGGRLRREVARAIGLRVAPNFRFFYDDAIDATERIESILREIHADDDGTKRGGPA